jgi:PAS domain S-box-containing protein
MIGLVLVRIVFLVVLLGLFIWAGRRSEVSQEKGWNFVVAGFCLVLFGSVLDFLNEIPGLHPLFPKRAYQLIFEHFTGYLAGLLSLLFGFTLWVPALVARGKANERVRESEKQYRLQAENVSDVIWVMDAEMKPTYYSPSIKYLRGVTTEEAMQQGLEDFLTPTSLKVAREAIAREWKREEAGQGDPDRTVFLELEMYHSSGRTIWTEVNVRLLRDEDGRPTGVIGVTRDVSRKKLAETSLKESEAKYRLLVNNIPDVMWIMDQEGEISFVSSNVEDALGYTPAEIYDGGFDLVLSRVFDDDKDGVVKAIKALFEESSSYDMEYRIRRKDGWLMWCRDRAVMSYEKDDTRIAYGLFSDITEHKETEIEFEQHRQMLQKLAADITLTEQRERRRVAGELHDRVIQGMALAKLKLGQLLAEADLTGNQAAEQVIGSLDDAIREARYLTFELSPPALQVLGLVSALGELVDRQKDLHGIDGDLTADDPGDDLDEDTRTLAYQAARELITNVVKHAGASKLSVSLHRENEILRMTVEDDGAGFSDPDPQPDPETMSGYGLFSLRERLMVMGGSFAIDGSREKGACVMVEIPVNSRTGGR